MSKKTLLLLSCLILIAFAGKTEPIVSQVVTADASTRLPNFERSERRTANVEPERMETDAIWQTDTRLTNNTRSEYTYYSGQTNVAVDPQGRVHVAWHRYNFGSRYDIRYCRYYPGVGWTADTVLTDTFEYHRYVSVAVDTSGDVHLVWDRGSTTSSSQRYIIHKQCTPVGPGNGGWAQAETISSAVSSPTYYYKRYPDIACSPDGNLHVCWLEYRSGTGYGYFVRYRERIGTTWQPMVTVDSSGTTSYYSYYPNIAVGSDNNPHVTWSGRDASSPTYYQIWYRAESSGVWIPKENVSNYLTYYQYYPDIAVNPITNQPSVVWRGSMGTSYYRIVHKYRTSGTGWSTADTVSEIGMNRYSYYCNIAASRNGSMHVVWYGYSDESPSYYQIRYAQRDSAGNTWSSPENITTALASKYYPSVTMDDSFYIHVVWYDYRDGNYEIYYNRGFNYANDVGVDQIYSPPASMSRNTSYSPEGRVMNYGTNAASSVPVYCQIDSVGTQIYNNNLTITSIPAGDTARTGLFPSWTSGDYGTGYLVRMFTNWGTDQNPLNDTMKAAVYIPALQWSQIPDLPAARYRSAGCGDTFGNFWVMGGWANSTVSNNLYKFDASTGTWSTMANMPGVNSNFCAVWDAANNYIYTFGGYDGSVALNATWRYHIDGDSWTSLANVPLSGYGYTAAIVGDTAFALYGVTLMKYHIPSNTWGFGTSKPLGSTSGHGGMCVVNGVVYHAGGWTADVYFYSYTPGSGWTRLADLPAGRHGLGLCAMDGKVYMVGGGSSWTLVPQPWVLVYNPADPGLGWAVENTCLGTGTYAGAYGTVTSNGISRIYASGGLDVSSTRLTFSQRAGFPFAIDVGVAQILAPSGLIGAGTYTPQARIKNYGLNAVGSFTVRFDINPGGYSDIQTVTSLNSGDSIDVSFANWTVSSGGFYTLACTTALATDQEPTNDLATGACAVYNYSEDFEASGVYTPDPASGAWQWGMPVGGPGGTPNDTMCWGTNITGSYSPNADWKLNSVTFYAQQNNPILAYWHWYEIETRYDGYNVKYSTDGGTNWSIIHALPGYGQPYDDTCYWYNAIPGESAYTALDRTWRLNYMTVPVSFGDSFLLRWHFGSDGSVQYWGAAVDFVCGIGFDTTFPVNRDVAVTQINSPSSAADTTQPLWPVRATAYNYGEIAESFTIVFDITGPVSFFYSDTQTVSSLAPYTSFTVDFDSVHFTELGTHNAVCYISPTVSGDSNVLNDTIRTTFEVFPVVLTQWDAMTPVPQPPSGKRPKSGTCMDGLEATGLIYFLKASNKQDFYSYDPSANTWTALETIPKGEKALNDGKKPKKGAAMAAYDDGVYVLRGNNTLGFWKYLAVPDTGETLGWSKKADFPTGVKKVKDGSGLVLVEKGGNDYLFASRGAKQSDFYLYDLAGDSWIQVTSPPVGLSGKTGYKKGTCMAYDGENVWVLQGYYGSFFKYNVEADSWTESRWYNYKTYLNREGKKKKPKDGAALVYHNDWIYMLKGGNTIEMWKIKVGGDTIGDWVQMDPAEVWDIPLGASNKKVKGGGCMIKWGPYLYAAKGKNTDEFYRHGLPIETATYAKSITTAQGVMGNKVVTNNFKLTIAPNPAINVAAIRYTLPVPGPVNIKLYNVTGALVKSHTITNPTKDGVFFIDAKSMPSGVYILRFNAGDIRVTRKMVLQK